MESITLVLIEMFGAASVIVFSLSVLGLLVFVWQIIQSLFPEPINEYQAAVPPSWQPAPPVPQEDLMASKIKRAVGYCSQPECEDFEKGVFLLNHGDTFCCPRCKRVGFLEAEIGRSEGNCGIFKEVRVEYNFDPSTKTYRELAIVRDESLWGKCNVYHLRSPLIKTDKRALKVAESILANLNIQERDLLPGEIPRSYEMILSFDVTPEKFSEEIAKLQGRLANEAWNKLSRSRKEGKADEPAQTSA